MNQDWFNWAHIVCSTRGAWLPGDERGFRSRNHRIHSTGDYENPPPPTEHAGLRRYASSIARPVVHFESALRPTIATCFAAKFNDMDCPVVLIAVAKTHVHALVGPAKRDAKSLMGRAKQYVSHQIRNQLPGAIWGQGCHVVRIRDEAHFGAVVAYINEHEVNEGAFVWRNPDLRFAQIRRP